MATSDLRLTQVLHTLMTVPPPGRDAAWCGNFLASAANASLAALDPQIEKGPDSFPYFQLALPDPGPFSPFSIAGILDHVLQAGAGVVIHADPRRDQNPAWVFTFGDMVAYSLFQDFNGDPQVYQHPEPPPAADVDRTLLRASPSEAYLPATARAAISRFMRGPFQHPDPKIGLVEGASLRPRRSLMVNLRASDYGGDRKKLGAAMRYLTWFVPKTYSVMPLPDDWPDTEMSPL